VYACVGVKYVCVVGVVGVFAIQEEKVEKQEGNRRRQQS